MNLDELMIGLESGLSSLLLSHELVSRGEEENKVTHYGQHDGKP